MVIDFLGSWITWFCACPAPAINMNDENASILALFIGHKMVFVLNLKSASNLNGNLNCSKELEHYAS